MSAIDVDEILEHQLNANMLLMPYYVYSELFDSIVALGDENAKLRELVRDMCVWAYIDSYCDLEERFADRMRELGIEVVGA